MSSSSSSSFVSAMDNLSDENNEHRTIDTLEDETRDADLTDHLSPGVDPYPKTTSYKPWVPCGHNLNSRNLIVCIDGTSNEYGKKNTNVIELYNLILKEVGDNQRTWYNSGIGTYAWPSRNSFNFYQKVLYNTIGSTIAWDFERTILGAYRWLSDNYEKDDCIFLFGFSRGAFQVRVLSAMIEKVGLIYKGNEMQIPFAYELYADRKSQRHSHFKRTFSRENVKVHFVGAWDTVPFGIARGKSMLPGTVDGMTHVCYFRHALALDEKRVKFLPEYAYGGSATEPVTEPATEAVKSIANTRDFKGTLPPSKEVWFAGTHSDIGGGNFVDNPAMDRSTPPLRWMVFEAGAAGLRTALFVRELTDNEQINIIESLTWTELFFEIYPFKRRTFTRKENRLPEMTRRPHLGEGRKIHRGQKIHSSSMRAGGSIAENYIPKAQPIGDKVSFWQMLRGETKKPTADVSEWLELDLYELVKSAVEKLVFESDNTALKSLHHTYGISGNARQAVYKNVIEALHKELTLKNKYLLLKTTIQLLKGSSRDNLDFELSPSSEIRPLLSDLFCDNTELYRRTALDFLTLFTNFVKVVELKEDHLCAFAMSPDGKRIAFGSLYGTFRILDAETGTAVGMPLEGHGAVVTSVAFSPGGTRMVSGSDDRTVRILDAETGIAVGSPLEGHTDIVTSVAFSPDGARIASGSDDRTVRIWDAKTGSPVGEPLRGHYHSVQCVAFSPDGTRIVSGSADRTVRIWHGETASSMVGEPLIGHDNWVVSVAFSPDGTRIVSGSYDKTVRIWDAGNGITLRSNGAPMAPGSSRGALQILDAETGNPLGRSPGGTRIVSGSDDGTVRILDAETGIAVGRPLDSHTDIVTSVAFSPDGTRIVSGSDDRTVRIWDAETGNLVAKPLQGQREPVMFVAFSPDGTSVTSVSDDGTVQIWHVEGLGMLGATERR